MLKGNYSMLQKSWTCTKKLQAQVEDITDPQDPDFNEYLLRRQQGATNNSDQE